MSISGVALRGATVVTLLLLSGCVSPPQVKQVLGDNEGYLSKNFAPATLPESVRREVASKDGGSFPYVRMVVDMSWTVSSDDKAKRARVGGAAHVVNYRTEDVAVRVAEITGGAGVDHVVDVDLGGNLAAVLGSVRDSGSIAYYASNGALKPAVDLRAVMGRNLTIRGFVLPTSPHATRKRAQLEIAAFIRTPGRVLSVAGEFPLYETAAAHLSVEAGGKVGTVVVACAR